MTLKSILLASVCAAALPALASAADLPRRTAPPVFVPPPPVFTWTGFYLGVNAGYSFDNNTRYRQFNGNVLAANSGIGTTRPFGVSANDDGFTGGGQIGYNYQFGGFGGGGFGATSFVLGLEADAAYMDLNKTVGFTGATTAGVAGAAVGGIPALNTFRSSLDYLGTVRGRVGVAFDRVLVYGTGGFAYGEIDNRVNFYNASAAGIGTLRFSGSSDSMQTGYTVGGGIEYAIPTDSFLNSLNFFHSSAVTIKAEYLYYDLGSHVVNLPAVANGGAGAGNFYQSRVSMDGNLIRAGLNYKF